MGNSYFQFKEFIVHQEDCAMKVTTEACLFGAWAAKCVKTGTYPENVLDIGAGTGLLSLMFAQQFDADITTVELDAAAATQCRDNFSLAPWKNRLQLVHADILTYTLDTPFDLILSNPPFYENDLGSPLEGRRLAHHSSALSLKDLLFRVRTLLKPSGQFLVLLPYKRKEELHRLATEAGLHVTHQCQVRNSPRHPWFRVMAVLSQEPKTLTEDTFTIRDEENNYTQEFTGLLRGYYLHL